MDGHYCGRASEGEECDVKLTEWTVVEHDNCTCGECSHIGPLEAESCGSPPCGVFRPRNLKQNFGPGARCNGDDLRRRILRSRKIGDSVEGLTIALPLLLVGNYRQ